MVCMLPWHVVDHVSIVVWVYPENLTLFFLILITYFSEGVWLSWDNMSSTWFVMRRMSKKWWSTISRKWTTTSYLNSVNIWKDHDKETNNHLLPQLSEHMKRPWQGNVNHLLPQLSEHMKRPWQGNEQPPLTSTQWTYEKTMTYDIGNPGLCVSLSLKLLHFFSSIYCQTCIKRSHFGQRKSGLLRQMTS